VNDTRSEVAPDVEAAMPVGDRASLPVGPSLLLHAASAAEAAHAAASSGRAERRMVMKGRKEGRATRAGPARRYAPGAT
jgi:hypothetical protein